MVRSPRARLGVVAASCLVALTLAAACAGGSSSGTPAAPEPAAGGAPAPTGVAADGQAVYRDEGCARCHGDRGQGGRATSLVPVETDQAAWLQELRAAHARDYPASRLTDAEVAAIYAWLQGLP